MKKPITLLLGASLCLFILFLASERKVFTSFFENEEEYENEEEHEKESGVSGQMMSWFTARAYPDPYYLNDKYMNGWLQAEAIRKQQTASRNGRLLSGMWNGIGPGNNIGGRILTLAIDPNNSNKLFAGSASGGIWKSTNGGSSWAEVVTGLPVLGVASIIIHPTNSNIIYAGTGEVYRVDSTSGTPNPGNTGFSVWKTRGTYGIGIIKSTDGGVTWSQVLSRSTSQLFAIQTLRFDPSNSNTVYACATDGLYRSTDAGSSWSKILNLTYVTDVVINGTSLVAAVGNLGNTMKGIYKSTNNGSSWTKITSASGLPASFQGFIKFGYVSSDPNTIVASIGVSEASGVNEIYKSTNFGTSWAAQSSSTHCQWQYWCAHDVAINPFATDSLVFGGVDCYKYRISTSVKSSAFSIHDDIHDIQFDEAKRGTLYICCDGGVYKSINGGTSFSQINSGLNATQFYASIGVSTTDPSFYAGGLQDNGQVVYNGSSWTTVSGVGGDGTACAIDPGNNANVLVSRDARGVYKSVNGGSSASTAASYWGSVADSRTAFAAPIAYSKSNPSIVYLGSDNLHKSTNGGSSFSNNSYSTANNYIDALHKTAITIAVSPTNSNKVYVSTSNFAQYDNDVDNLYLTGTPNVLKTTTGNTPFSSIMGSGANMLPDRFIMDFAISNNNDDSVFVAVGGFGTAHVYVTGDGGANWIAKGTGLPDVPFNAVLIDPVNPQVIYAAGDLGVYVSPNRGNTWYDFNNGFWDATQVVDLQATADNQLIAATHGKGVFVGPRYSGILPVSILSFTGEVLPTSNKLKWSVAQELNVQDYEIERSLNGTDFKKIASVKASNAAYYNYTDFLSADQSYYYRLKTVDRDGSYDYSGVVYLRRSAKEAVQVLSNPFANDIKIKFTVSQNDKVQISLYDAGGKLVRREQARISNGQSVYTLDNLANLPGGTYYLEAIVNNQRWRQKLLKH
jgi:photosystem II stability/assembly factor-like uncharacterized protein